MSRSDKKAKNRGGTTRDDIRRSRKRQNRTARLTAFFIRSGKIAGAVIFALWIGTWLWLGGGFERAGNWARHGMYELSANIGFSVQDVLVEGRENADPDVLLALINTTRGDPLFAFNPAEAKDLIERISWVKEAHVERRLPHTIYISLIERKPLALWQNKGKVRLIDSDGVTIADRDLKDFTDLVIITGENAPKHAADLMALLAAEPVLDGRIEGASWVGDRRWDLKLNGGTQVRLPEDDPGFALRRLAGAQEEDGLLDKKLDMIDLREADRITVRTAPGAVQEYKASFTANGKDGGNI